MSILVFPIPACFDSAGDNGIVEFSPKSILMQSRQILFCLEILFNRWVCSEKSTQPKIKARNKIIFGYNALVQLGVAPTELYPYYFSLYKDVAPMGLRLMYFGYFLCWQPRVGATPL